MRLGTRSCRFLSFDANRNDENRTAPSKAPLAHCSDREALLPLAGCLPEPNFPDEPIIEFQSFDLSAGGGRELVIGFSDGDGNVGLAQADTLAPFCPTCEHSTKTSSASTKNGETPHGSRLNSTPMRAKSRFTTACLPCCADGSKPGTKRHHQHRHEFVVFQQSHTTPCGSELRCMTGTSTPPMKRSHRQHPNLMGFEMKKAPHSERLSHSVWFVRLLRAIRTELRQEEEQVRRTDLAVFVYISRAWVGEVEFTRTVFHGR